MGKRVIGIVGMPGSGKSTAVEAAQERGASIVVMGDIIRAEADRRGLERSREAMIQLMFEFRKEEGLAAVAKRCVPIINNAKTTFVIVEGIRSYHEVQEYHKHFPNFTIIAIYAPPNIRFKRLKDRGRSDDPMTIEEFNERDLKE